MKMENRRDPSDTTFAMAVYVERFPRYADGALVEDYYRSGSAVVDWQITPLVTLKVHIGMRLVCNSWHHLWLDQPFLISD
jgi:hypothetical protein